MTTWSDVAIETTLVAAITSGAASLVVTLATGYPAANFYIVIDAGNPAEEVIFVGTRTGTTFSSLTRAAGIGSVASAHSIGASVIHAITGADFNNFTTAISDLQLGFESQSCLAVGAVDAGDWVQLFDNSGVLSCRKALASDATKPAAGFVLDTVADGATVRVYTDGTNDEVPLGAFVAADRGSAVFLSASTGGRCTITPPSTAGNLLQKLGRILDVGSTVSVAVDFGFEIVV